MNEKLRAGLAVYGSALERWDLPRFLAEAGLPLSTAYSSGSRDYRVRLLAEGIRDDVEAVALRPEVAPEELWAMERNTGSGGLDIAITGSDIAAEADKAGYPVKKLGALGIGNVDIVMAVRKDAGVSSLGELLRKRRDLKQPTIAATEYYKYLAAETIASDPVYKELYPRAKPQIMVGGKVIAGDNPMVVVKYSEGKTEIACVSGFAHLMVENVQSGDTLRLNDYVLLGKLGESWYRLYAGPHITKSGTPEKWEKAILVRDLLRGRALGQRYTYAAFDFPLEKKDDITDYMEIEGLYTVKPFIATQNGNCETKILVPRRKIAAVIEGLKEHGSKAIMTLSPEILAGLDMNDEEQDKLVETKI